MGALPNNAKQGLIDLPPPPLTPLQRLRRSGPPDPKRIPFFSLGNPCQYIGECQVLGRQFGDPMDSPPSSDLPPCRHLALPPVQTAPGTSSTRHRSCLASIPAVCRETTHSFVRNRPISFAVTQNSEYPGFPFFFFPFLLVLTRGEYLRRLFYQVLTRKSRSISQHHPITPAGVNYILRLTPPSSRVKRGTTPHLSRVVESLRSRSWSFAILGRWYHPGRPKFVQR